MTKTQSPLKSKPVAAPISVDIGIHVGKFIPVTLIPANDAAADVVNALEQSRQPQKRSHLNLWSG